MNPTHVHLLLTHFPIIGTLLGTGILAYGVFSNNDTAKKIAFATFILMGILTIPVFMTGEPAEETVENLAGVSENIIEEHEELAEKAIWLMGLLGIFSLFNFIALARKTAVVKTITFATLVVSLATFGVFAKVGNLGGQIRHTEIRADNSNTAFQGEAENGTGSQQPNEDDEEDD